MRYRELQDIASRRVSPIGGSQVRSSILRVVKSQEAHRLPKGAEKTQIVPDIKNEGPDAFRLWDSDWVLVQA
jgi:hypothetical protein